MAPEPSSSEVVNLREGLKSEIAELRQQLDSRLVKLQDDVNQAKLLRAEKYAEYMRNWLAILSLVITVTFVGFGILGYTRFSDVETYRKQMASEAADVAVNAKKVADGAATVQHVMGDLQTRVSDLDKRIDGIEARSQKADQQIVSAVDRTSAVAQQTRNDLFSTVSSGIYGTDLPAVSRALLVAPPAVYPSMVAISEIHRVTCMLKFSVE